MYFRKQPTKLTGSEKFKNTGGKTFSVLEFWQYGFSSLNSNVLRGALAEFIVENALKENKDIEIRSPWGDYDVLYKGKKIEVKCCSYIQDWDQSKLSTILWSGLKAKELYYSEAVIKLSELSKTKDYKADVYVLSFVHHTDPETLNILDLNQWSFFVLSREEIKEISNDKSSMSLARLVKNNIQPVSFQELSDHLSHLIVK